MRGRELLAIDLPGHGNDRTPLDQISLRGYRDRVCNVVLSQAEPVILVAHSMGGIVASEVAEDLPDRICHIVYLTAFLLENGRSLWEVTQPMKESTGSMRCIEPTDALCCRLYSGCNQATQKWASSKLLPEPILPLCTPIQVTKSRFGRIPRTYIECLEDQALPIQSQRRMSLNMPCERVVSMHAGHSPFFSVPDDLASILTSI